MCYKRTQTINKIRKIKHGQNETINKEIEIIKKNQINILELRITIITVTELKKITTRAQEQT